jgi:hypothetical protein
VQREYRTGTGCASSRREQANAGETQMREDHGQRGRHHPIVAAGAGAVGGFLGSWMMVRMNHLMGPTRPQGGRHGVHRRAASPNETDGTISDEPASMQVASQLSEAVGGSPLSLRGKRSAGPFVHYAFGILTGAFYGVVAERQPALAAGAGVPFGVAVWALADEVGLPIAGLSGHPSNYPLARHASALATHLAFGATVEGTRHLLLGRRT